MVCSLQELVINKDSVGKDVWKISVLIIPSVLTESNTNDNSMINRSVRLFYLFLFERIPPYGLFVYLIECLCSVSRHE